KWNPLFSTAFFQFAVWTVNLLADRPGCVNGRFPMRLIAPLRDIWRTFYGIVCRSMPFCLMAGSPPPRVFVAVWWGRSGGGKTVSSRECSVIPNRVSRSPVGRLDSGRSCFIGLGGSKPMLPDLFIWKFTNNQTRGAKVRFQPCFVFWLQMHRRRKNFK